MTLMRVRGWDKKVQGYGSTGLMAPVDCRKAHHTKENTCGKADTKYYLVPNAESVVRIAVIKACIKYVISKKW